MRWACLGFNGDEERAAKQAGLARFSATWAELVAARERQPPLFIHWHLISATNGCIIGAR
jgi:hypothetical protein